jgi:hypothetical protein
VALSTEPNHPPVFALLARTRNLAADDALVTALPRMEPALRATALTVLLERDRDPALAGVVAHYGTVDADLDTMLRGHAERLSAGVRLCMASEQFEVRRSAVELIRASESGKLAYLLSEALKQPCRKTAQFAAETLAMLTDEAIANPRESASSRTALARGPMDYLVAALQNALASWPMHFRPEVVLAAARLARALERIILTQAEDPRVNVARAFNNAISGSRDPRLAGYCLRALRSGPLRVAAGNLLADTRDPTFAPRWSMRPGCWPTMGCAAHAAGSSGSDACVMTPTSWPKPKPGAGGKRSVWSRHSADAAGSACNCSASWPSAATPPSPGQPCGP